MAEDVKVPLPDYIREAAREAARTVIREHLDSCSMKRDVVRIECEQKEIKVELDKLRWKFAVMLGLMAGAGGVGGMAGGSLVSLLGG
jgi:hypothetical protein